MSKITNEVMDRLRKDGNIFTDPAPDPFESFKVGIKNFLNPEPAVYLFPKSTVTLQDIRKMSKSDYKSKAFDVHALPWFQDLLINDPHHIVELAKKYWIIIK